MVLKISRNYCILQVSTYHLSFILNSLTNQDNKGRAMGVLYIPTSFLTLSTKMGLKVKEVRTRRTKRVKRTNKAKGTKITKRAKKAKKKRENRKKVRNREMNEKSERSTYIVLRNVPTLLQLSWALVIYKNCYSCIICRLFFYILAKNHTKTMLCFTF